MIELFLHKHSQSLLEISFLTALCTKEWRSAARDCGQQIEGHESFLATSVLVDRVCIQVCISKRRHSAPLYLTAKGQT